MMEDYNTKEIKNNDVTFKAASGMMYDFFFPGSGLWKPLTIRAASREEAEEMHKLKREPIEPPVEAKEEVKDEVKEEVKTEPAEEQKADETQTNNE